MEALKKMYKLDEYALEQMLNKAYISIIKNVELSDNKKCNITIGQNGSGKSTYSKLLASLDSSYAVVNGDHIRSFHPDIKTLMSLYPDEFGYIIYEDWQYVKDEIVKRLISDGYSFTYESSARDTDKTLALIQALKTRGYNVKVSVIALSYLESRIRVLERFFRQLVADGVGRISDHEFQKNSYMQTEEFLNRVDMSLIDEIEILDANFIPYGVNKASVQKKEIIDIIRMMYEVYSEDNLLDRFALIKMGSGMFRHLMSDKLYERLYNQMAEIEYLLSPSRK